MADKPSIFLGSAADRPTEKDSLGFEPYVESVAKFLESPNTQPPLAISIEGEWGAGKSSFMKQLKNRLAGPSHTSRLERAVKEARAAGRSPVVAVISVWVSVFREPPSIFIEFNAWRHDKEDALWAAFALTCTRELKKAQPIQKRFTSWFKLLFSRLKGFAGWVQLSKLIVVTTLWLALLVSVPLLLWIKGSVWTTATIRQIASTTKNGSADRSTGATGANRKSGERTDSTPTSPATENPAANLVLLLSLHGGTLGLWAATLILGGSQLKKLGSPLETDLQKILSTPEYEGKTAFVETFHQDFSRLLDAYCKNQRVYIFIDDLDRCEVPKAADLMQAINLMINEDPRLVFIIGMDREKVAASIVAKYAAVLQYVDELDPPGPAVERLGFGYRFLDKFIQIQFKLPQPRVRNLKLFARDLGSRPSGPVNPSLWELLFEDRRSDDKPSFVEAGPALKDEDDSPSTTINRLAVDIQIDQDSELMLEAVDMVAPVFNYNPRRLKQFVNLFRLSAFIGNKLSLFDEVDGKPVMTFAQLAKFVAISMKWPAFIRELERDRTLLSSLFETSLASTLPETGWLAVSRFLYLMRYGCVDADHKVISDADSFSLNRLDVDSLLAVTAPALRSHASPKRDANASKSGTAAEDVRSEVADAAKEPQMDGGKVYDGASQSPIVDRANQLARDYEETRRTMPASDERTAKMTALVRSARRIASTIPDPEYPLNLFFNSDSAGDRIVSIGIAQGCPPKSIYFPLALEGILNARSAFEQFHALSLADNLLNTLSPDQKNKLWAALNEQRGVVIDEKDKSRWNLRSNLLKKMEDTMPTVRA